MDKAAGRFRAALFDLDGTLLDTLDDIADSMNRTLVGLGCPPHPVPAYRHFVGDGVHNLALRTLPRDRLDAATVAACVKAYREDYNRNWRVKTRPYDGIDAMLQGLAKRSVMMAVLSNKPHDATVVCVEAFFPDVRFDAVVGQREGIPHKPDPGGARDIARRLGVAPAEFLYLGDTATDMQTAVAAGMHPVGALWGFRTRQELLDNGAKDLAERPQDVLGLI